jgi:hypothetical protein
MPIQRCLFYVHRRRESKEVALEAGPVWLVVAGGAEYSRLEAANRMLRREEVIPHLGGVHNSRPSSLSKPLIVYLVASEHCSTTE